MRSPAERREGGGSPAASVPSGALGWLEPALEWLSKDELVAFPTETVWGLAARAESRVAVERMRSWKGRAHGKPVSILVAGPESLDVLGAELGASARRLVREFWPGPLTLVVRCRTELAPGVAGDAGALGIRCSSHPVAARLARAAERGGLGPLTASSLNRSGCEPARSRAAARRLCGGVDGRALLLLPGEALGAAPSTVLDATGDATGGPLRVLREGAIPASVLFVDRPGRAQPERRSHTKGGCR